MSTEIHETDCYFSAGGPSLRHRRIKKRADTPGRSEQRLLRLLPLRKPSERSCEVVKTRFSGKGRSVVCKLSLPVSPMSFNVSGNHAAGEMPRLVRERLN